MKNKEKFENLIGKIGVFYNKEEESNESLVIGKLISVTCDGLCKDVHGDCYDSFTELTRAAALEMVNLDLYCS
jgi:hypothetical protein